MRNLNGDMLFSPSDLITYMESPFASALERQKLSYPDIAKLIDAEDPLLVNLQQKGYAHEGAFAKSLEDEGHDVLEVKRASTKQMASQTVKAIEAGQAIIIQGYLCHEQFAGYVDFLVKVPGKSRFGEFEYEVWDTKLSKKMKPYFAIQLCCYSEMLEAIQGVRPKNFSVVLGDNTQKTLRVHQYFAYYQSLKKSFLHFHDKFNNKIPSASESVNFGRWSELAKNQLEELDHLSQVANLSRQQIKKLEKSNIITMQQLAEHNGMAISGMPKEVLERVMKQATLQIASRGNDIPKYKVLLHVESAKRGLAILPPHSDYDVFFDIEGYPNIDGGLEYLWGNTYFDAQGNRTFKDFWAHDSDQEKQIFVEFIDWIYSRWLADPKMHVYHYANYEIAAIRKLMGRYGVCEEKVDNLLRNNVFVDLYNVVRHGVMIGEPRYSIKNVEHIYRGQRETEVTGGGESIIVYESWRENPDGETWENSSILKSIRDYNIDDCDSTQELTQWLREEQSTHEIQYLMLDGEGEKELPEEITQITKLRDDILNQAASIEDEDKKLVLETLAWSLEFHRRENKPTWWQLFERLGCSELELYDDMDCLAGLRRTERKPFLPTKRAKNFAYEYSFNIDQPYKGQGKSFYVLDHDGLKVARVEYDADAGTISLQNKKPLPERISIIPDSYVRPDPIPKAIYSVVEELIKVDFLPTAITDFLTRSRPRIYNNQEGSIIQSDTDFLEQVITASLNLENSYLCIQGPPGAGKTYTAKHIIGELLKRSKRVGVSSNSHKAIINLLDGVAAYVEEQDIEASLIKAGGDKNDPIFERENVNFIKNVKELPSEKSLCFGGTAWAFCNEVAHKKFDYLFIDEAGQVSVANLIGMSQSCDNIILMGDQMQLGQPIQGSHPGESGMSILEYLLEGAATISDELGVFLPKTYRMHPDVCSLISNQVYDGRLKADAITSSHLVQTTGPIISQKAGICFVPVEHEGNTQGSDEEVVQIKAIANELMGVKFWSAENNKTRAIGWNDILFVAPYNFQVNKLRAALGDQARIGSVDKFQGQEAPIVILSMCASDASESPRGIDFLFSKNRLNVAISRAQALAIIVGNPKLANTSVNNLKQMELINFYCEIVESNFGGK